MGDRTFRLIYKGDRPFDSLKKQKGRSHLQITLKQLLAAADSAMPAAVAPAIAIVAAALISAVAVQ